MQISGKFQGGHRKFDVNLPNKKKKKQKKKKKRTISSTTDEVKLISKNK